MDTDKNEYLSRDEFCKGFFNLYCTNFDDKMRFIFKIYDFDNDGLISKDDIATILNLFPICNESNNIS